MNNWQPIETAPKDGTRILIARPDRVTIARWNDDRHNIKPRPYWDDRSPHGVAHMRNTPPTHWQPLPEPP